mmetsp:Transcript_39216/g.122273  ORF Transcript_39216/g.122273 Transcript_39216/m.122273 type:complete len:275 (+) Transcript_39216:914-1738(+)
MNAFGLGQVARRTMNSNRKIPSEVVSKTAANVLESTGSLSVWMSVRKTVAMMKNGWTMANHSAAQLESGSSRKFQAMSNIAKLLLRDCMNAACCATFSSCSVSPVEPRLLVRSSPERSSPFGLLAGVHSGTTLVHLCMMVALAPPLLLVVGRPPNTMARPCGGSRPSCWFPAPSDLQVPVWETSPSPLLLGSAVWLSCQAMLGSLSVAFRTDFLLFAPPFGPPLAPSTSSFRLMASSSGRTSLSNHDTSGCCGAISCTDSIDGLLDGSSGSGGG